jgi:pyridoxal phosphate enzyme (YggS family)
MIAENIQHVSARIAAACEAANRHPDDVTLVAVSKTHPVESVLEAVEAGVQHFGENRVEEAQDKIPAVSQRSARPLAWHMIGHIQSRKAKEVIPLFGWIQSVDSLKLAGKLSALAVESGRKLDILLEVNISGEEAKYGFSASGWATDQSVQARLWAEIRDILSLPGLNVRGLMTMAPIVPDPEDARPVFAGLAALRRALSDSLEIPLPHLSMGMTDDYPIAVEEGATLVRVGRAIFGEREK